MELFDSTRTNDERKNKDIKTDAYYSEIPPDYAGECPDCDICGTRMLYNWTTNIFKCPECGHELQEDDWVLDEEADIPFGCLVCGGPWPDCITSCNIFDE